MFSYKNFYDLNIQEQANMILEVFFQDFFVSSIFK
jgi:hypothetical protein